ncbi:uncharacterized protein TRIADDRAFT_59917 [Trichoplax adhaerens]|uniref:BD-FAE-like domain-containing protein n=1 Tax=Trichoplax adhaerens TaxID=10228 RepID=B3S6T1_TRIAD|nr:hypothetical protein TRIADDRAFT_59917 [Trichoplax adhaerens]EDV21676.1 hypothetical protein TRIADDRAFT_59917 [Trichoplax adhaerens]|eukprot:XP_002115824.1 hypothetical protein TRIADDRAFT_59917 [Trichoplax adhaerens]
MVAEVLSIIVNYNYGWPTSPPFKRPYLRALNPIKILQINREILYYILSFRHINLYFMWKKLYNTAKPPHLYKDIPYSLNGCRLDIHRSEESVQNNNTLRPIVIYIYGGAWMFGSKQMYCVLAANLANLTGCVVCCPNYLLVNKGNVVHMLQDLKDCTRWLIDHGKEYGGDPENILFVGHSSGAHLSILNLIELISQSYWNTESNNIVRKIKGVIALAGVYDIPQHLLYEIGRGVEDVSGMYRAMLGVTGLKRYSPYYLVQDMLSRSENTSRICNIFGISNFSSQEKDSSLWPHIILLHGENDTTVPVQQSEKFYQVVKELDVTIEYCELKHLDHTNYIIDMMNANYQIHKIISEIITPNVQKIILRER